MTSGLAKSERHGLGNEELKSFEEPSDEADDQQFDDNDDYQIELDDYESQTEQSKPLNKKRVRKTSQNKINTKRIKSKSTIAPKLHNLLNLASNMFAHHHK